MTFRLIFMGTPEFAVPTLSALADAGHDIVAVYTQPPRPAGRGMAERRSAVHERALELGLDVLTPANLKSEEEQAAFAAHNADAAVVVAYGLILPRPILAAPAHGCFNVHASALPRWRGAAPIQRAIMAGDTETAVAIMAMEPGLDTGPVYLTETVAIRPDMTAGELHDELAAVGARLMVRALSDLESGVLKATPQSTQGVLYASKIDKSETRIDFTKPASDVVRHILGLSPFPGAWFEIDAGGKRERVKVLRAVAVPGSYQPGEVDDQLTIGCGEGAVRLVEVQRAGRKAVSAAEFLRGFHLPPGTKV
jgi:methionyl-tRNA formyltransferase